MSVSSFVLELFFCMHVFVCAFTHLFCVSCMCAYVHVCPFWHVLWVCDGGFKFLHVKCVQGRNFSHKSNKKQTDIRNTSSSAEKTLIVFIMTWIRPSKFSFKVERGATLWCQIYPSENFSTDKLGQTHVVHIQDRLLSWIML